MRKKIFTFSYLALGIFLFCWINLPKTLTDRIRGLAIALLHPWIEKTTKTNHATEIARLTLENQNLRSQIDRVYEWLLFDQDIHIQIDLLKSLMKEQNQTLEGPARAFLQRRAAHLGLSVQNQLLSMPAQVIYRDPSSWSSSLWLNVGEEDNHYLGYSVVAKNSPVVSNGALVGVVDHVEKHQSRVRLITDSGLSPSVRAVRGSIQTRELFVQLQTLLTLLDKQTDLFSSEAEKKQWIFQLNALKEKNGIHWEDNYLAKGEVHGSSAPFWRSRKPMLKGIGFNFDYGDEEGSARDLKNLTVPLIKEGDLLVTSGLDGVFPPGFRVGTVTQVEPLKEGSYCYNIEAAPCAHNLNNLETVFILPALCD